MKLYKYTSAKYALEFLKSHEIKVTTLEDANDPDEWVPYRKGPDGRDYLAYRDNRNQFRMNVGAKFGFVSLSSQMDNNVMWGHYADKFKGVLLEFDAAADAKLRQVDYRPTRYIMDDARQLDKNEHLNLIARKGAEWSYEAEWRFFVEISECRAVSLGQDRVIYLFPPEPKLSLTGIVLGPECPLKFGNVKMSLESWRDRDVAIRRLAHDSLTYALRVTDEYHTYNMNNVVVHDAIDTVYSRTFERFTGEE